MFVCDLGLLHIDLPCIPGPELQVRLPEREWTKKKLKGMATVTECSILRLNELVPVLTRAFAPSKVVWALACVTNPYSRASKTEDIRPGDHPVDDTTMDFGAQFSTIPLPFELNRKYWYPVNDDGAPWATGVLILSLDQIEVQYFCV